MNLVEEKKSFFLMKIDCFIFCLTAAMHRSPDICFFSLTCITEMSSDSKSFKFERSLFHWASLQIDYDFFLSSAAFLVIIFACQLTCLRL